MTTIQIGQTDRHETKQKNPLGGFTLFSSFLFTVGGLFSTIIMTNYHF